MSSPNVPGFLTKTYEIFNSPEYSDLCSWGPNEDTIIIKKVFLWDLYLVSLRSLFSDDRLNNFLNKFYQNILSIQTFNHLFDN